MSLLTCCPSCGTQFRVVSDQLRISDGWVRCGRCQEVFDASQSLQEYHEPEPAPLLTRPPAPAGQAAPAAPRAAAAAPIAHHSGAAACTARSHLGRVCVPCAAFYGDGVCAPGYCRTATATATAGS